MLVAALRDLQWRRRRVIVAVIGTALVFGLTLVMTGVSNGFSAETSSTVDDLGADSWLVREGAAGPFLGASAMSTTEASYLSALPGIDAAAPVVFTRKSMDGIDVNLFGGLPGKPGMPTADSGRQPSAPGEVLVSSRLPGYDVGDTIVVSGVDLTVVGEVKGSSALAGTPNLFLSLEDAQRVGFGGLPVVTAIAVSGNPTQLPEGFITVGNDVAREDLLRAIAKATSSLTLITALLWLVAASIIGAVVYLTALERQRDFAVFKATGVQTRSILGGMVLQAAILAVGAAIAGSVIAVLLAPRFPMFVALEMRSFLTLPFVAVIIGTIASIGGMRRVATVDPALAFGGP
jgi:putative ABC transport system permease protein